VDRQGVDGLDRQQLVERGVHGSVAGERGLAREYIADDDDLEVGLAPGVRPRRVHVTLVDHV
jgi:hypothetical protein